MGKSIQPGGNRHDGHQGQKNFNHDQRPDFVRDNPGKHRYENHDELTNDENFYEGKPTGHNTDMDFRDKSENLEDESGD